MAITMIDPVNVKQCPFARSHLLAKLRKLIVCARLFESRQGTRSILVKVAKFDLEETPLYERIERDYEFVRRTILTDGFDALTGRMGSLVQLRTEGPGHGSKSRAFYARKELLKIILGFP